MSRMHQLLLGGATNSGNPSCFVRSCSYIHTACEVSLLGGACGGASAVRRRFSGTLHCLYSQGELSPAIYVAIPRKHHESSHLVRYTIDERFILPLLMDPRLSTTFNISSQVTTKAIPDHEVHVSKHGAATCFSAAARPAAKITTSSPHRKLQQLPDHAFPTGTAGRCDGLQKKTATNRKAARIRICPTGRCAVLRRSPKPAAKDPRRAARFFIFHTGRCAAAVMISATAVMNRGAAPKRVFCAETTDIALLTQGAALCGAAAAADRCGFPTGRCAALRRPR